MKLISPEQIQTVLNTFYATNITAKDFDLVKQFFDKLENVPEEPNPSKK